MKTSREKTNIVRSFGLHTDMYELTMGQAYLENGTADVPACFDHFFRNNLFGGGYVIFAGLRDVLEALTEFQFGPEELDYLRSLNLSSGFVEHLLSFRFRGDVYAVREGEVVFPLEPVASSACCGERVRFTVTRRLNDAPTSIMTVSFSNRALATIAFRNSVNQTDLCRREAPPPHIAYQ